MKKAIIRTEKQRSAAARRRRYFEWLRDIMMYVAGAALYAISVDMFTAPNEIAPGGVTGIATILNILFDLPIGVMMMVINIPLFILGFIVIGWRYISRSLVCLGLVSVAIDLLEPFLPAYQGDMILASIFGGIMMGLALGLIFIRGGSTGGTDIIARLLGKLFPHMTQGKLILAVDLIVVSAAGVIFGLEQALYAVIALFICSFVVDRVVYGLDNGKMIFIITSKVDEVNKAINEQLERGTTVLKGRGGYSGGEREVIMCAIRRNQAYKMRAAVRRIDPEAFIIAGDATEILGNGFRALNVNEFGETDGETGTE